MSSYRVAAFTDTYRPTVNGVTYTVSTWSDRWNSTDGSMPVVYPASSHIPSASEHPVRSVPLPLYTGFRIGLPKIPAAVREADIVHAHTPFGLGLAGVALSRRSGIPFVVSYHTPTPEYTGYVSGSPPIRAGLRSMAKQYESWFLDRADRIIVPTTATMGVLPDSISRDRVSVISNGVDIDHFEPSPESANALRSQFDIPTDHFVIGYTGRHGHEKQLQVAIDAIAELEMDCTLILAGDGPARSTLGDRAESSTAEVIFPGFLDREQLPGLYTLFDCFVFPSPIETEGLVALEAIACGTPVVGARAGALPETISEGETGYTATPGDVIAFRAAISSALTNRESFSKNCLDKRSSLAVEQSITELENVYSSVRTGSE